MALHFENICYAYGTQAVLEQVNLTAKSGEITCLLGASGGGKSTLLRLAAGLENLQQGKILLDNEVLAEPGNEPVPEQRPVGLMFQENALFPHLTIAENIAFGIPDTPRAERDALVSQLLLSVGLEGYGQRYPHTLSGGQQQRVALARSLAPEPQVLLMDEPYASIDSTLRRKLREAARQTLKQSGTTTILVTHDPSEAMEMADTIAVLDGGRIVQAGSPKALYEVPQTPAVAGLFGGAQTLDAQSVAGGYLTDYGVLGCNQPTVQHEQHCTLVVRPAGLQVSPIKDGEGLTIVDSRYVGGSWLLFLLPDKAAPALLPLRVAVNSIAGLSVNDRVTVTAKDSDFFAFANEQTTKAS